MRRVIALLLAAAMAACLTACGGEEREEDLLCGAAGVSPGAVLLTVDGREVPAGRYLYWLARACDYLAACCGGEDICWEDTVDGMDLETYAREQALSDTALYATVENWAEAYGCALTEEDLAARRQEWAARAAQYGGEEAYLAVLAGMGLDREGAESLSAASYLYRHLYDLFCTEGSALFPAERDLEAFVREQEYLTVDHIWISTAAADSTDTAAIDACRARAEEAFSKLNDSPDPVHDFAVLAETYSDETDRGQYPNGYTFQMGDGTLPAACEEAAAALEPGQFSGVIEAEDGFYLLLRRPADLEAAMPDYFDALLQAAAESAECSLSRACQGISVRAFYENLTKARAALPSDGEAL